MSRMGKGKAENSASKRLKVKKTIHLPGWICDVLEHEGDMLGNKPGLAAAAAILMFSEATTAQKATSLRRIHDKEVADAYARAEQTRKEQAEQVAERIVKNAVRRSSGRDTPEGSGSQSA